MRAGTELESAWYVLQTAKTGHIQTGGPRGGGAPDSIRPMAVVRELGNHIEVIPVGSGKGLPDSCLLSAARCADKEAVPRSNGMPATRRATWY